MKIFIVCNSLGGGGAERVGVMLANGFALHQHEVYLITDIYQKQTYEVNEKIHILPLHKTLIKNKLSRWSRAIFLLRQYVKQEKPDVVIGIMALCSFVARMACLGQGVPVIMTEHDAYQRVPSEALTLMERFSKFYLDKIYTCVTLLTEADKRYVGNRLKNAVVMPNPSTFPAANSVPEKKKVLLAAGRVSNWHYKGFDILIQAWGKIAQGFPEWKLQIAGDGPKENFDFLKNLAKECHVSNRIDFLGYRTDMLHLYQQASIFVLSSRSEGLPMVVIEAMGQGCACCCVENFGRTKETIQNKSEGLLCQMENPDSLASIMREMLSNDDYRHQVQKNSIERAKYYSLDHIVELWEGLLGKIINPIR